MFQATSANAWLLQYIYITQYYLRFNFKTVSRVNKPHKSSCFNQCALAAIWSSNTTPFPALFPLFAPLSSGSPQAASYNIVLIYFLSPAPHYLTLLQLSSYLFFFEYFSLFPLSFSFTYQQFRISYFLIVLTGVLYGRCVQDTMQPVMTNKTWTSIVVQ